MAKSEISPFSVDTMLSTDVESVSDEEALQRFLLDIDCLDQLDEWAGKFNLFDVLKITRTEIRHSNLLAWLLTPNENHGLNDNIIMGFIQYAISSFVSNEHDIINTLLMDFQSFVVYRELHNIDILAKSDKEKFILCIENKIDTGEHSNQLVRYQKTIRTIYSDYKVMYIFLSPTGEEASMPDTWISMSYDDVIKIIEAACKKHKLLPDVELFINHYLDTIRRDIVEDKKLAEICAEIYNRHRSALDLIYENKPDRAAEIARYFRNWGSQKKEEGFIEIIPDKCGKTFTRFKTNTMSEILPDVSGALSGWNTNNFYFYELVNLGGTGFYFQLSLSSKNIPDDLRKVCDEINVHYPSGRQKENWQWRSIRITNTSKINQDTTEDKIYELLNKQLDEIQAFESGLLSKLGQ